MGVAAVYYDGYEHQIDASNAYEIYLKYRRGEKFGENGDQDLNVAQIKYCQSFLSDEQLDEIEYDDSVRAEDNKNEGLSQIAGAEMLAEGKDADGNDIKSNDKQKADSIGGSATVSVAGAALSAGATAATAGVASGAAAAGAEAAAALGSGASTEAASAASTKAAAASAHANGWVAAVMGAIVVAFGAASVVMSQMFDSDYKTRTEMEKNSEANNQALDANTDVLIESMDAMNEDMAIYEANCQSYTDNVNADTGEMASLQTQLQDAQAAGDTEGVAQIKAQMQEIEGNDHADELEGLQETRDQLDEYSNANGVASGVSQAGQSVSDFLKVGKPLGTAAYVIGALDLANAVLCAVTACLVLIPKMPFFIDAPAGIAAGVLFAAAAVLFGASGGEYMKRGGDELKCADSGEGMQEHINSLNDMLEQQAGYIEETSGTYDAADDASAQSMGEAADAASEVTEGREAGHPKEGTASFGSFTFPGSGGGGDGGA